MKKVCILAALALMLLPVAAMAGMTAASDADLAEVTGQTGITIDMTMTVTATGVAWGDDDGFGTTLTQNAGWVVLSNTSMPSVALSGVTIDAGSDGTTSYLAIGTSGNIITGDMVITDVIIGSSATASTESIGEVRVSGIGIGFGTIKISGHD